ncbi:TIGR02680 family protein [Enterococcus sp. LJL51]|uniref:TIGR02680 family protein n=1 Tax=Enterococcus sp. LJL51 TaxID=3416656 RepID=UPI003CF11CB8
MANRWIINRVGLLNFWYYTKETFELADGRMLLRGTNGSGKSLTMQSLFPVLFDGDTSAYRLDSFGSRDRKMEDYLLGEKGVSERNEGIGYLFLEVKREAREEYLTVGVGMHANRGGTLKKWYFSIENNQRVDKEFDLYEELRQGELTPLTKAKLKNRLEGKGRIFETQREYKLFVNQRIFGFDNLDQFDELITLLLQLRSPKLSKDFRPSVIYGILRNSLPKMKEDELLTLSKTIEQLDLHRERLEDLSNEIKELDRFAKNYHRWHGELVSQVGGKWQQLFGKVKRVERQVADFNHQLEKNNSALMENRQVYEENEQRLEALTATITQLSQHEGMDLVNHGLELKKRLKQTENRLERTKDQLLRKQQSLQDQLTDLKKRELLEESLYRDLEEIIQDNQQYLTYLRFEELDSVYSEKLRQTITVAERKYWLEQTHKRQTHFRKIQQLLLETKRLQEQLAELERIVGNLQQEFDELQRDLRQWQQTRADELERWKLAIDDWLSAAPFQLSAKQYSELLYRMDSLLEEEEREEIVLSSITVSYQEALKQERIALVPLEARLKENQHQILNIQQEIEEWQTQKIPEPRRNEDRKANRNAWAETAEHVLFYQGVDFQAGVTEEEKNNIEGALFSSGILDSVISQEELQLADDLMIKPNPQLMASTLSDVLTVNSELSQSLQNQVVNVLDSIFYNEADSTLNLPVINKDGSYQITNLNGEMPIEYKASFIGIASQERYRQEKIEQLKEAIQLLKSINLEITAQIVKQEQQIQLIESAYQKMPRGTEVYQTYVETKNLELILLTKEKEIRIKTTEANALQQRFLKLKTLIMQETAEDQLSQSLKTYEDALQYAMNYEQNLHDAFSKSIQIEQQREMRQAISTHVANFQEEEADLSYNVNALIGETTKLARLIKENQAQQQIINIAELTAKLTKATEEQLRLQKKNKQLNNEQIVLVEAVTKITGELKHEEEHFASLIKQEEKWRALFEVELQRGGTPSNELLTRAKELGKELNIKELKRLEDRFSNNFSFIADQLQSYQPKLISVSGVDLSSEEEQELGEFASFNNHNEPQFSEDGQRTTTVDLLVHLKEQRLTLSELLKKDDERLFKKIILESVGKVLRVRIQQAQQWVAQMNELLQEQKNSSGLSLSISWKGVSAASEQDLSTNQLVSLLQKPTELLSEHDRTAISRHFQEKVRLAQEQLQNEPDDRSTLFQAIAKVLDYRDWFEFELKYKRANEGYQAQPLTDRRFNQFSGGEKAIAMYLPLFAATYSRYEDAGDQCPRIITLDEAFAGIDDQNIAELFKACEQLGFNYVMNSQALFGDYPTVSKLAIYELLRPQNVNFVTTIRYYWDGHKKHLLMGGENIV